jgi:hypothetical protein
MEDRFEKLAQLRAKAFSPAESDKILETMLSIGTFAQLESLYTGSFSPLERARILKAILRIATYDQLEELQDEILSPADSEKVLDAMVALSKSSGGVTKDNTGIPPGKRYDFFIAHAAEDAEFAAPLAFALKKKGLEVALDDFVIQYGDWLQHEISRGLAASRYGILILSQVFFNKVWPQKEAEGLATKEQLSSRTILPVLHNYDVKGVAFYSPTLAARITAHSNSGVDAVAKQIFVAMS